MKIDFFLDSKNNRIFQEYPKSKAMIPAWQIHEHDPCRIMSLAVYKELGNNMMRRRHIERLHLFANDSLPAFIKRNIGAQVRRPFLWDLVRKGRILGSFRTQKRGGLALMFYARVNLRLQLFNLQNRFSPACDFDFQAR